MGFMTGDPKWRKIQRASEWPIAAVAFGSAVVVLAYRLGALPTFEPMAVWGAALIGILAGVATVAFVASGLAALWAAHADQPDAGQRAISVLKAGLKLTVSHSVCRACVGRGFTWKLAPPIEARTGSGAHALQGWQEVSAQLKVECPSCGGDGFIDL